MSQIIISTNKFLKTCGDAVKHTISKKIFDESVYLIKNIEQDNKHTNIELLNLLISLKDLGSDYLLEADALNSLLDIENQITKISYFQLVVILYYIEDIPRYGSIREIIEAEIVLKIEKEESPFHKAELTCLLFDAVRCPYVSRPTKESLIEIAFKKIENRVPVVDDRNRVINYIAARNWFIDWSQDIDLDSVLHKKELRTPY